MKKTAKTRTVNPAIFALLLVSLLPLIMFGFPISVYAHEQVENGTEYDPQAALSYAAANWYSEVPSDCVRYVRACLSAGGFHLNCGDTVRSFYNELCQMGYEPIILDTKETKYGLLVPTDNIDLQPGDPILSYCPICDKFLHTTLVGGIDDTYVTVYGHSRSQNNTTLYVDDLNSSYHIPSLIVYGFKLSQNTEEQEASPEENSYTVDISDIRVPNSICIRKGQCFGLDGIITSDSKCLSQIGGTILNSNTKETVQSVCVLFLSPLDRISIEDTIDDSLVFDALLPGTYTLTIYVRNTENQELTISETTFTVVDVNKLSGKKRR